MNNILKDKNIIIVGGIGLGVLATISYLYFKTDNSIIRNAKRELGEEELPNNIGFKSPRFQKKMESVGFKSGFQWCNIFAKYVWLDSLHGKRKKIAKELLSPSTQVTWQNFKNDKSGYFEVSQQPKKGSLVVWQSLTDTSKGHIGIVVKDYGDFFKTIEGNSNNVIVDLRDLRKGIRQLKKDDYTLQNVVSDSSDNTKSQGSVSYQLRSKKGDGMKLLGFINIK